MYNDVIFLFSSRASCYYICNQKKRKDIVMKTNNICKFVVSASEKQIFTTNFVLEHDLEQMRGVHQAENYSMRLVLSGNGKISIGHMSAQLQAGTVFFTFPKLSYELDVDEQFTCMYITFYGLRAPELLQRFRVSSDNCVFEGNEGLIAFWQNSLGKANENNLDLISESVLLYTFAQMSAPVVRGKQRLVDNIIGYLEEHFKDTELSLSTVAEDLKYHPKYISRTFREEVGISFTEYVKNMRIQYAVFLMENGITTVKNLTLLSGFKDPYYFSNVFKAVVGVSPSKYISKISGREGSANEKH